MKTISEHLTQHLTLTLVAAAAMLAACSQPAPPPSEPAPAAAAPAAAAETAPPAPAVAAAAAIAAPAGAYSLDTTHSSLAFSVNHLGLSTYVLRFTKFDARLNLDPANPANSSVTVDIDPSSIRSDYPGDYKAGHADSGFSSWDEDLARSPKFLNSSAHPTITFKSRSVEPMAGGDLRIAGDLTLLGQTHPVTLDAKVVGSAAAHPFNQKGAIGFAAMGTFERSTFGMTHLVNPPLVGDTVTIHFNGEFHQADAAAPVPAG